MSAALLSMPGGLLMAVALVAAGGLGWQLGRAPLQVQLAQSHEAQAKADFQAAERRAAVLQRAQDRGDALTRQLVVRQAQITSLEKDRHAAIDALTLGRPCLSAELVRLLNDSPAEPEGSDVPQAPGSAAAAGAAFATDADVGNWSATARAQYESCRARLDALIDWHLGAAAGGRDAY